MKTLANLVVDYRYDLFTMIRRCNFSWVNPMIDSRKFPFTIDVRGREIKLEADFMRIVEGEDLILRNLVKACSSMDYRQGTLPELLACVCQLTSHTKLMPLVALGSGLSTGHNTLVYPVVRTSSSYPNPILDLVEIGQRVSAYQSFIIIRDTFDPNLN